VICSNYDFILSLLPRLLPSSGSEERVKSHRNPYNRYLTTLLSKGRVVVADKDSPFVLPKETIQNRFHVVQTVLSPLSQAPSLEGERPGTTLGRAAGSVFLQLRKRKTSWTLLPNTVPTSPTFSFKQKEWEYDVGDGGSVWKGVRHDFKGLLVNPLIVVRVNPIKP
jgi:hypothetical protein